MLSGITPVQAEQRAASSKFKAKAQGVGMLKPDAGQVSWTLSKCSGR